MKTNPWNDKITEAEAKECTEFVQQIVDIGYEEFERLKPHMKWYGKKIMTFFRLPHTELHDQYMKVMSEPAKRLRQEQEISNTRQKMNDNIREFIKENFIQPQDMINVRYWIIDIKKTVLNLTGETDIKINIGIPYWNSKEKKNKFWKWMIISESKTPWLFYEIRDSYPEFKWESDLVI